MEKIFVFLIAISLVLSCGSKPKSEAKLHDCSSQGRIFVGGEAVHEYRGQCNKENKYHGHGEFYDNFKGFVYVGEFVDGAPNGYGKLSSLNKTLFTSDILFFEGEFQDGKIQAGTAKMASGDIYVGAFLNQFRHGQGEYTWKNGDSYVGEFRKGQREGKGEYVLADGTRYVGMFSDDLQHGQGEYIWPNGDLYKGDWRAGLQHGKGAFTSIAGTSYIGEYSEGKPHGQGVFTWSNGDQFKGLFRSGVMTEDYGVFTSADDDTKLSDHDQV